MGFQLKVNRTPPGSYPKPYPKDPQRNTARADGILYIRPWFSNVDVALHPGYEPRLNRVSCGCLFQFCGVRLLISRLAWSPRTVRCGCAVRFVIFIRCQACQVWMRDVCGFNVSLCRETSHCSIYGKQRLKHSRKMVQCYKA